MIGWGLPARGRVRLGESVTATAEAAGTTAILGEVERILAAPGFTSRRMQGLLRHLAEATLAGRAAELTERGIGARVFGRGTGFDPASDPVVRIQLGLLRRALLRHYQLSDRRGPARVRLHRGSCVPTFGP